METKNMSRSSELGGAPELDSLIGTTVGNYRILEPIGDGGMGYVYLAEHPRIGKRVALKVLRPELATNPSQIARFVNEAKAVAAIGHRNIVDIFDFGELPDGRFYFSMEFLPGHNLEQEIRRGVRLSSPHASWIASEIGRALAAAHRRGIVHRDIKAENVFLCRTEDGEPFVKVLDFGIAKLGAGMKGSGATQAGVVFGTPEYMAPEQARQSATVDHRADIYSLGVLLYEMLTGSRPFEGEDAMATIVKHLTRAPADPRELCDEIPAELASVVLRCLAKHPDDRFADIEELQDALAPFVAPPPARSSRSRYGRLRPESPAPSASGTASEPRPSVSAAGIRSPSSISGAVAPTPGASLANGELEALGLPGPRGRIRFMLGAALGVAALGGLLVVVLTRSPDDQTSTAGSDETASEGASGPLSAARVPSTSSTSATASDGAGLVERAEAPATIALPIDSRPSGASVYLDDEAEPRGSTPLTVRLPSSVSEVRVTLRREGYETVTKEVRAGAGERVELALEKTSSSASKARGKPKKKAAHKLKKRLDERRPSEDAVLKPSF